MRHVSYRVVSVLGLLCVATIAAAPSASAQAPIEARGDYKLTVGADLAYHTDSNPDVSTFSPLLFGIFGVTDSINVEAVWGLAMASLSGANDESGASLSNPFLGAYYALDLLVGKLQVGGGLALPLASSDKASEVTALAYASAMRGRWNSWLWTQDALTFVPSAKLMIDSLPLVRINAEADIGVMIATEDGALGNDDTEILMQLAGEALLSVAPMVELGARLQGVWLTTADNNVDAFQSAVEPLVQVALGPAFARAGVLLNLDGPLGILESGGADIWALRLSGGARF